VWTGRAESDSGVVSSADFLLFDISRLLLHKQISASQSGFGHFSCQNSDPA
jgi:hypothetical protein